MTNEQADRIKGLAQALTKLQPHDAILSVYNGLGFVGNLEAAAADLTALLTTLDEAVSGWNEESEKLTDALYDLTALQTRVGELEAGTQAIAAMTDPDDPDSYRADDREGCLDAVHARAASLTPPLEPGQ